MFADLDPDPESYKVENSVCPDPDPKHGLILLSRLIYFNTQSYLKIFLSSDSEIIIRTEFFKMKM